MSDQLRFDRVADEHGESSRDLVRELEFLRATRGQPEFIEHVAQRLAEGDETSGTSYLWVGVRKLIDELLCEAADLGGWAALADEALDRAGDLTDLHREQLRGVLRVAARRGAEAHATLTNARFSLERKA